MGIVRLAVDGHPELAMEFRVCATWCERLRGLLGTDASAGAILLARCSSIHTFGMRYAIDVAFLDELGEVVLVRRSLPPRTLLSCREACCAIERPEQAGEWLAQGSRLKVVAAGAGIYGR